ncbi:MAG: bifunctional precorrin-2 dehydrogenase/sirohydrochlorin ferrochelatase [bacterium]
MRDESRIRKTLPVNLMLEGRSCLVVGSGQIAARKVGHLLEAGASVTVVGPEASEDIRRWTAEGRIQYKARPFRSSDLKGQRVVVAATDSLTVNGEVLRLCRQKNIMCSAADAHWTEADFLIPATLRRPHLTLTISTGGESCRRARLTKDYLARHLDILGSADLIVVSIKRPRRTAKSQVIELGAILKQIWGIHEFVILNRADRIEVLAVLACQTNVVAKLMMDCIRARFPGRCCVQEGASAVEYVAEGLCGDSRLPSCSRGSREVRPPLEFSVASRSSHMEGEPRVSRVTEKETLRAALRDSTQVGWAGVMMKEWMDAGLRLADKIRIARAKPLKSGVSGLSREYQRQYESIIRSI